MIHIMNPYSKGKRSNEEGIVAIFAVMIIMAILTLLTIGFSNITRQAQKRTLDDALNTQAYYAAESGVNSAVEAARANLIPDENTDCESLNSIIDYDLDPTRNIGISCLLVDPTPTSFVIDEVPEAGADEPFASVMDTNNNPARFMEVEWNSAVASDPLVAFGPTNASPVFTNYNTWGPTGNAVGVLRVDLVPLNVLDRAGMVNQGYTFYVYPTSSNAAGTHNSSTSNNTTAVPIRQGVDNQGNTIITQCNIITGDYRCKATVAFQNAAGAPITLNGYRFRLTAYYNPVKARLSPKTAAGGSMEIHGSQVVIDSTGKANDVFQRIQVRVDAVPEGSWNTGDHNEFSVFSGDSLCKRLSGAPGNTQPQISGLTTDPACGVVGPEVAGAFVTDPPGSGDADVGGCPTSDPNCDDPGGGTGGSGVYIFWDHFYNNTIVPPGVTVSGCIWDWDHGTPQPYPANHPYCQEGAMIRHDFPDYTALIDSTNGNDGCYRYTIRLTMQYTNAPDAVDSYNHNMPRGSANDPGSGICVWPNSKWRPAP